MKLLTLLAGLVLFAGCAATDPLPSWNDGPSKQAAVEFVKQHDAEIKAMMTGVGAG